MKNKYSVAIIGAGRIGSAFDTPTSEQVLSHAHAFSLNTQTKLVALIDSDSVRGEAEAKKWNTAYFRDIESTYMKIKPDIVVIATPDETHISLLQDVIHLCPKLIVCEKPVQISVEDGERVGSIETEIPVVVNYRRRFDASVMKLRDAIVSGETGAVLGAVGIYSGGFLHNGSHLIDLARLLFGEMVSCTTSSHISFGKCQEFHILESNTDAFSIFELDILTEKGRFRFIDEGFTFQTQEIVNDPVFEGYKMLGRAHEEGTRLIHSMEALARHCVEVLEGGDNDVSPLHNALQTENTCFSILTSA